MSNRQRQISLHVVASQEFLLDKLVEVDERPLHVFEVHPTPILYRAEPRRDLHHPSSSVCPDGEGVPQVDASMLPVVPMGKRDVDLDRLEAESAMQYAKRMRTHFASKADHNKRESLFGFLFVVFGTLAVSAFVAFGTGELLARIVPVCLALSVTAASTWLHFRRPHQLWAIYRSAQRYIENNQVKHQFDVDEYGRSKEKDRLLAKNVALIALKAHELWVPLIPSPEGLDQLRSTSSALVPPVAVADTPQISADVAEAKRTTTTD